MIKIVFICIPVDVESHWPATLSQNRDSGNCQLLGLEVALTDLHGPGFHGCELLLQRPLLNRAQVQSLLHPDPGSAERLCAYL